MHSFLTSATTSYAERWQSLGTLKGHSLQS